MKKVGNTEAELKISVAYKKKRVYHQKIKSNKILERARLPVILLTFLPYLL